MKKRWEWLLIVVETVAWMVGLVGEFLGRWRKRREGN